MSTKYYCDFLLFRKVINAAEVRQACVDGKFRSDPATDGNGFQHGSVAILKSSFVLDPMQLKVAVSKAVLAYLNKVNGDESCNKMKTRSLDTEIVFYLSPSKSISDSLKQFGVGDDDQDLVAVIVVIAPDQNEETARAEIERRKTDLKSQIRGEVTENQDEIVKSLYENADVQTIAKIHKVQDKKNEKSFLSEILISRSATKDLL